MAKYSWFGVYDFSHLSFEELVLDVHYLGLVYEALNFLPLMSQFSFLVLFCSPDFETAEEDSRHRWVCWEYVLYEPKKRPLWKM